MAKFRVPMLMKRLVVPLVFILVLIGAVIYISTLKVEFATRSTLLGFVIMIATLLRDIFPAWLTFRQEGGEPNLRLVCKRAMSAEEVTEITPGTNEISLRLYNDGDKIAKFPTVDITWEPQISGISPLDISGCSTNASRNWVSGRKGIMWRGRSGDVVLPKKELPFMKFVLDGGSLKQVGRNEFYISCDISAEGMQQVPDEVKLPIRE